jgi:hypothetical protein
LILGNIFLERGTQALLVEDLELISCFEILGDQIFDVDLGKLFRIHGNIERRLLPLGLLLSVSLYRLSLATTVEEEDIGRIALHVRTKI